MKILLAHSFYQSHAPSGEDGVFLEDVNLLKSKGHQVILFTRHNDTIKDFSTFKKMSLAWRVSWSQDIYKSAQKLILETKPDIAHICNTFPLISPSIYYALSKYKIPVVQTVQNYRIACAAGVLFRNNAVCEKCISGTKFNAIKYGCYRQSKVLTIPVVLLQLFHERIGTWRNRVDMFVAATNFSRQKLIESGLPPERIAVRPNFFVSAPEPDYNNEGYALFLGRLSPEKGVRTLLKAWKNLADIPLKIVGDGELKNEVEEAANHHHTIEFLGHQSHEKCLELMRRAMFLVMPSEWYEGFPMTIREAFACGKPVIGSRMGAMSEIITDGKTGLLFTPGSSKELTEKVKLLTLNTTVAQKMGRAARIEFESKYSVEKNYQMLMDIYQSVRHNNSQQPLF